jgi:glutaredoxin
MTSGTNLCVSAGQCAARRRAAGMRKFVRIAVLALMGASAIPTTLAQTLYKSVSPDGRIVYSDHPPSEGRIEKTLKFEDAPSSELPASASSYVEQLRRQKNSSPAAAPASGVVLYSASWCGYCKKAKAYLAGKGIAYREFDIDTKDGLAAYAKAGGGKGIPLLVSGSQHIQGYSLAAYDDLFASRK